MRWILVVLVLLAGCADGARELGIDDASPGSIPAPDTELAAADVPWVEFEARWVCDLERSTYADPADVQTALVDRLAEEDIDESAYQRFKTRLANEPDLSAHVQAAVIERCGN